MSNNAAYDRNDLSIRERIKRGWIPTRADFAKMTAAEVDEASIALDKTYRDTINELLEFGKRIGIDVEADEKRATNARLTAGAWDNDKQRWVSDVVKDVKMVGKGGEKE